MRRMPTPNDFKEIDKKIKRIENDIISLTKYVTDHIKPYYIHRLQMVITNIENVYIHAQLQLYNSDNTRYESFQQVFDKFGIVRISCTGYISINNTAYPIVFVSFQNNTATFFYWDVNEQDLFKTKTFMATDDGVSIGDEVSEI